MSWYVAIAKNGRTMQAVDELVGRGHLTLCPIERSHIRIKGRRHTVEKPLLGGYLIVEAQDEDDLSRIRRTAEIAGILSSVNGPLAVPAGLIDELLEADAAGRFDKTKGVADFGPGQKVRITKEGAFQDLIGRISKAKGRDRWQIVLEACRIPVTMAEEEIEPATEKAA